MIDLVELAAMVEQGYVRKVVHPLGHLELFNYSEKCTYEGIWNDTTRQCRGLILDLEGNIVARPFSKFFNWGEGHAPDLDLDAPVTVTDKLDGSLGILYRVDEPSRYDGNPIGAAKAGVALGESEWAIATRGSFTSDQAIWATEWFGRYADEDYFDPANTYLFEILADWNRIVVRYDWQGLVLLGIRRTATGEELDLPDDPWLLQAGSPRDDSREHEAPQQGLEDLSGVSGGQPQEGLREVRGEAPANDEGVERAVSRTLPAAGAGSVREGEGVPGRVQDEDSLPGLRGEVPAGVHGLRSRSGGEGVPGQQDESPRDDGGGDREVRSGVRELPSDQDQGQKSRFRIVDHFPYPTLRAALEAEPRPGQEGLVVFFPDTGDRVKLKQDDYVAIHRLVFGLTARRVWEHAGVHDLNALGLEPKQIGIALQMDPVDVQGMIDAAPGGNWMDELLMIVPEEFAAWAIRTHEQIMGNVDGWEQEARDAMERLINEDGISPLERKDAALLIKQESKELQGALFALLDGKSIRAFAWRAVKPEHETYKAEEGE